MDVRQIEPGFHRAGFNKFIDNRISRMIMQFKERRYKRDCNLMKYIFYLNFISFNYNAVLAWKLICIL